MPAGPAYDERPVPFGSEVRFGIVMYGGVSLAIYINGVANELYEMACATPKPAPPAEPGASDAPGGGPAAAPAAPAPATNTRAVYRKLSWLLHNPALRAAYLAHLRSPGSDDPLARSDAALDDDGHERTRFVVDVIAGTSAGGINGVFLAKALANGQAFAPLKKLWVQEGDLSSLLNDPVSYQGLEYADGRMPPRSLLNSDRMYIKLYDAMAGMDQAIAPLGHDESPLSDGLDLYVTTTDIRGAVVPLRLFDRVVYERRHKQVYHFNYTAANGGAGRNDFAAHHTPFLAFAARCTSSFPFAFEPMQLIDAQRLCGLMPGADGRIDFDRWKPFFTGLSPNDMASGRYRTRAFGDGGYLDNKPFSYVVEALSWRQAALPIERKLIYVDPAPQHPERERRAADEEPDAIENALSALTKIPQYETIREDLEAVLKRNRRIERVERIVRKVEEDIETRGDPFGRVLMQRGQVRDWSELDVSDLIDYYGVAFLPYRRLRISTVNDDLADRLADRWGVDRRSDRIYAMRALVRAWRDENFYEHRGDATPKQQQSENGFLDAFDMKYRVRRIAFLLRKTHQLARLAQKLALPSQRREGLSDTEQRLYTRLLLREPGLEQMNARAFSDALLCLRAGLGRALEAMRGCADVRAPIEAPPPESARQQLDQLLGLLIGEETDPPLRTLEAADGGVVAIDLGQLPLPSPLRTLQENVFARARGLFRAADLGRRTRLQGLLEDDIGTIREHNKRLTEGQGASARTPLARDLLGRPTLAVQSIPNDAGAATQRVVVEVQDVGDAACAEALNSLEGRVLRRFLAEYYLRFDEYDQMSFPLYYDTGTGEPSTVEVVRVSPEDAPSLIDEAHDTRRKLAGTALFNFGAFLDTHWRRNDIMWGRLDGCERLITTLLPADEDKPVREALVEQAHRSIVREEMTPLGYEQLVDAFAQALAAQPERELHEAFSQLWAHLDPSEDQERRLRMAQTLRAVLGESGMSDYVRDHYEVNRRLDTERTMQTASRAITITGRILEGIERKYRGGPGAMRWVTRLGIAVQALLAVSAPKSLNRYLFRHWLALLYLFEVLVFLGAIVLGSPPARTFALTAFTLTAAVHLVSLVVGDLMHRRSGWLKLLSAGAGVATVALAAVGAWTLIELDWQSVGLSCGAAPAANVASASARRAPVLAYLCR